MPTNHLSDARRSPTRGILLRTLAPAVLVFLVLAGCGDELPEGPGPGDMEAVLHGTVTSGGSPIEGAEVVATPFTANCMDQLVSGSFPASTTDADGRYGQTLRLSDVLGTTFDACLTVEVTPPPGTGLQPAAVQAVEIQFRSVSAIPPMDSARVDVEL